MFFFKMNIIPYTTCIYIYNVIKCKCYTVVLRLDMNLSPVSEMRVSHVKAFVDGSGKEGGIC